MNSQEQKHRPLGSRDLHTDSVQLGGVRACLGAAPASRAGSSDSPC